MPGRFSVTVTEGELQAGDTINVVYGDMSGGGRGFTPPPLDRLAGSGTCGGWTQTGDGRVHALAGWRLPCLNNEPGPPVELLLVLESPQCCGQENARPHGGAGRIPQSGARAGHLLSIWPSKTGAATIPATPIKLGSASTWGCGELTVTPTEAGVLRLRGTSHDGRLYGLTNPSKVTDSAAESANSPAAGLYWGDIHSHSQYSWDGTGTRDDHFRYARYASLLDIYSATDHNDRRSMSQEDWEQNVAYTEKWYTPGAFRHNTRL